jgi:nucleolar GTP-binding protein
MNFQNLHKIESYQFYLDLALSRASKKCREAKSESKSKDRLNKYKTIEMTRLDVIRGNLSDHLKEILNAFPRVDDMDPFYNELVKLTLEYHNLKRSLGAVKWGAERIDAITALYRSKIAKTKDFAMLGRLKTEYIGRASSFMKQLGPYLIYLDEARKTMKDYPAIKTACFTVCIFGFPNAGKSTLLKKMTGANPEIKPYAFTTKTLNLGYIEMPAFKVQVIDTPGSLNRIKANNIELHAYLAVKYLAEVVIYVFDPMMERPLEEQEKLLSYLKKVYKKTLLFYVSKTDIAKKEDIDLFREKYELKTAEEIKAEIIKLARKRELGNTTLPASKE